MQPSDGRQNGVIMPFEKIKKNFGFGCMRLKMNGDTVDYGEFNRMIDQFIDAGFNYFDTAHGYIDGKSELAIGACLSARYDREAFVLANKLSEWYVKDESEIIPFFENQLKACGVDYFDFYLLHSVRAGNYERYKAYNAFGVLRSLKEQGKIRHIAMSFHDTADVLDRILSEQPDIEAVQLQLNYLDYDDPGVQSKACYDVAVKHGKKVIVMEPVKGGALASLPEKAAQVLEALGGGSQASYALRYAASYPNVIMVLSGMGNMDMMKDNLSYMTDFKPLGDNEWAAIEKVCAIFRSQDIIPCTDCKYCTECCPMHIPIPALFACLNGRRTFKNWNTDYYYEVHTEDGPKASDCIKCGMCEKACPQHLKIRDLLEDVEREFEKK